MCIRDRKSSSHVENLRPTSREPCKPEDHRATTTSASSTHTSQVLGTNDPDSHSQRSSAGGQRGRHDGQLKKAAVLNEKQIPASSSSSRTHSRGPSTRAPHHKTSSSSSQTAAIGGSKNLNTVGHQSLKARDHHVHSGACSTVRLGPSVRKCCLLYTSPSPRDATLSRMPSSA